MSVHRREARDEERAAPPCTTERRGRPSPPASRPITRDEHADQHPDAEAARTLPQCPARASARLSESRARCARQPKGHRASSARERSRARCCDRAHADYRIPAQRAQRPVCSALRRVIAQRDARRLVRPRTAPTDRAAAPSASGSSVAPAGRFGPCAVARPVARRGRLRQRRRAHSPGDRVFAAAFEPVRPDQRPDPLAEPAAVGLRRVGVVAVVHRAVLRHEFGMLALEPLHEPRLHAGPQVQRGVEHTRGPGGLRLPQRLVEVRPRVGEVRAGSASGTPRSRAPPRAPPSRWRAAPSCSGCPARPTAAARGRRPRSTSRGRRARARRPPRAAAGRDAAACPW